MTDAFNTTPSVTVSAADLVGEGKKFKTVDDLAKGKAEADAFIEQLKKEQADLRKELSVKVDTEATLTELRNEMKALKESKSVIPSKENTTSALSENDLKALVSKTITESEANRSQTQNIVTANNQLVKHYGTTEKAQEALRNKAQELGLSIDELKGIAARSPTALLKMVLPEGVKQPEGGSFQSGSLNSDALPHQQSGEPKEGTKEYFDMLRTKDKKRYWSAEVQNQIFKAAMAGTYDHTVGLARG